MSALIRRLIDHIDKTTPSLLFRGLAGVCRIEIGGIIVYRNKRSPVSVMALDTTQEQVPKLSFSDDKSFLRYDI